MPKPDFNILLIGNCSLNQLLIKHCFHPCNLRVIIIIIISSFQFMYISTINPISFTVTENCPKSTIVGDVSIYKKNSTFSLPQVTKIYSIESIGAESMKDLFVIDSVTGIIRVNQNIDREMICPQLSSTSGTCSVALLVTIVNDIVNIIIIIVDENDNTPFFEDTNLIINIKESTQLGTKIFLQHATDIDSLDNGIGEYRLTSETVPNHFLLKYNSTAIYLEVIHSLDYEKCTVYHLILSVCDQGTPKRCSSQILRINIIDVNDNYPIFKKQNYFAIINEDHPVGKIVIQVTATDLDSKKYGLIKYNFASSNNEAKKWFQLDSVTGELYLIRPLTMVYKNFQFVIEARDNGPVPNVNRTLITIHIKDINNHFPDLKITESTFPTKIIKIGPNKSLVSFYENNPRSTDIVFIVVTDKDSDDNGRVICSMKQFSSNWLKMLKFNSISSKVIYRLVALESANCEDQKEITVVINCSDSGEYPKSTIHTIVIRVLDMNEFPAVFNKSFYSVSVKENTVSFSLSMPVYDNDCTSDFSVIILDAYAKSHFRYLRVTQRLIIYSFLDYEKRSLVNFSLEIINKGAYNVILTSTTSMFVTVIDVNDNFPVLNEPKTFRIAENAQIGSIIGYVKANDSDENENGLVKFQKLNLSQNQLNQNEVETFIIESDGLIKLAKELDREKENVYVLAIFVSDMGNPPLSITGTITISVTDINDNNPQWIFPNKNDNKINESIYTRVGIVITRLHATDMDDMTNNNITYHIISENAKDFFLHPMKGELSYAIPPKQGTVVLDIIAVDNGTPSKSNQTQLFLYISDKISSDSKGLDSFTSYSYFPLVAIIPTMILICIIMFILCLLLVVRRRNACNKNRRNQLNNKAMETLSRKPNLLINTSDKLLQNKVIDIQSTEPLKKSQNIDTLDLTQTNTLPKASYQCLVTSDLDICSADSGEGASEDDISNYLMLKTNEHYRMRGCSHHCCSLLPENTIAHFICSTINQPMLYSQPIESVNDEPNSYLLHNTKCNSTIYPFPNAYKMSCLSPMCEKQ